MNEVNLANHLRGSFDEAVLLSINEQGGEVSIYQLEELAGDIDAGWESVTELRDLGLVVGQSSMAGEVVLTNFGRRVADRIRKSMVSGARRADAVRRGLLTWLTDPQVRPSSVDDFVETAEAVAWGVPFTTNEVSEAADLLNARGYIQVITLDQVGGLRPRITPDGRDALRSDVLISEYGWSNPTTISNDYSSKITFGDHAITGGVISGGQGNSQHIEQTIGKDLQSDLADQVTQLIKLAGELPDETPGAVEVRDTLAAMEEEIGQPKPRRHVVKDLALKALTNGVGALGSAGGQQLMEALGRLAHGLTS